jgi:succinate dehydrogenase / fumarate reductase flavoprotein subunit
MGGIPNEHSRRGYLVNANNESEIVVGLYAVVSAPVWSVHLNRLGTNSLLDLLVFGRAGNHIVESNKSPPMCALPAPTQRPWRASSACDNATDGEYAQDVANDIRAAMQSFMPACFARKRRWTKASKRLQRFVNASTKIGLKESKIFNTARIEALVKT